MRIYLILFCFLSMCSSSFAAGIYKESFSTDPQFTSLNSTYAHWDSAAGNYYVKTRDDLNYKYWAYKNIPTVPAANKAIMLRFDVMFECQDWGTYPGVFFYSKEPVDRFDPKNRAILSIYNAYASGVYKKICVRDDAGNSYLTPTISDATWYTVSIAAKSGDKADIKVEKKDTGQMIAGWKDVNFALEDFSYLGVGFYDKPDYGRNWSPIRIDNVEIATGESADNSIDLTPILALLLNEDTKSASVKVQSLDYTKPTLEIIVEPYKSANSIIISNETTNLFGWTVSGVLVDGHGKIMPNATVGLECPITMTSSQQKTTEYGRFSFCIPNTLMLAAGVYELKLYHNGKCIDRLSISFKDDEVENYEGILDFADILTVFGECIDTLAGYSGSETTGKAASRIIIGSKALTILFAIKEQDYSTAMSAAGDAVMYLINGHVASFVASSLGAPGVFAGFTTDESGELFVKIQFPINLIKPESLPDSI